MRMMSKMTVSDLFGSYDRTLRVFFFSAYTLFTYTLSAIYFWLQMVEWRLLICDDLDMPMQNCPLCGSMAFGGRDCQ